MSSERIVKTLEKVGFSPEAIRAREIQAMGDTAPPAILNLAIRMMSSTMASMPTGINTIVSNVPGPPIPLYTAGARIESMYPISIISPGMGLNFTVMSYMDRVDFGITVDPDLVPDPWYIAEGIPIALEALSNAAAAEVESRRPSRKRHTASRSTGATPHATK